MKIVSAPLAKNNEVKISIKTTQFVHTPLHTLSWLYIEVKLITIILKSKENLALKGRLSNAATITKQIMLTRRNSSYYKGQGPWCL